MKKLSIILTLTLGLSHVSQAQIIDSLPYFKQELILEKLVNPFFQGVIYNEGVAALKDYIDPKFKPPVKGWIRDSMFNHIKNTLAGIEYQDGNDLFLLSECEYFSVKGDISDSDWVVVTVSAPEITNPAIRKGVYDPLRKAYDLNPNDLSVLSEEIVITSRGKYKNDLTHSLSLLLKKQPNGNYKIYPDGDLRIVLGESDMRGQGLLTDDGTLVLFVEKFLKSIRKNDKKTFRSVFDEDLVRSDVWTDMRPLSKYRKMPEYRSYTPQSGNIVILELEDDLWSPEQLITWGGDVATFVAVYKLPDGKTASKVRAPSDIFNSLVWRKLEDLESQDKVVSGTPGFAKSIPQSIILGPIIGTLIGKGNNPDNYITVIFHKKPGTNNFNIGMPPSMQ